MTKWTDLSAIRFIFLLSPLIIVCCVFNFYNFKIDFTNLIINSICHQISWIIKNQFLPNYFNPTGFNTVAVRLVL